MGASEPAGSAEFEKNDTEFRHVDAANAVDEQDDSHGFTPTEQRRIIRRVDRRLVVTVGAMYCVSLMDRTNMSAANIAGMSQELLLTGFRYVSPPPQLISNLLLVSGGKTVRNYEADKTRTLPTSSSSSRTSSSSRRPPSSSAPSAHESILRSSRCSGAPS